VNLLELLDLRVVKQQISRDERMGGLPVRERAACVKNLLETKAEERHIVLK